MDDVFRALADGSRRELLDRLYAHNGQTLNELCARLAESGTSMTRQAVSKHLGALARAGLVEARREGRETRYTLTPAPLAEAMEWMADAGGFWDRRLDRLADRARRSPG